MTDSKRSESDEFRYAGTTGHSVKLIVEDGHLTAKLVHPEQGCAPGEVCGHCGRAYGDPETEPCYDCKGPQPIDECWLTGWFDNLHPEDLLQGKVEFTVPVVAGWDMDHPVITLLDDISGQNREPGNDDG